VLEYQVEFWFDFLQEAIPLFKDHWEELDKGVNPELQIDYTGYANLAKDNKLLVVTIRDNKNLVGYSVNIIQATLHFTQVKWSFADFFYIIPKYRKGFVGIKLFKEVEKHLKTLGVSRIFMGTRLSLDLSKLFNKLGYKEFQKTFIKDLT
jgi:predicted acetyltransferase